MTYLIDLMHAYDVTILGYWMLGKCVEIRGLKPSYNRKLVNDVKI